MIYLGRKSSGFLLLLSGFDVSMWDGYGSEVRQSGFYRVSSKTEYTFPPVTEHTDSTTVRAEYIVWVIMPVERIYMLPYVHSGK